MKEEYPLTIETFQRNFNDSSQEYTVLVLESCIYLFSFSIQGTYKSTCISSNMLRCEVGDLSGKHAMLNVGSGKEFYTDPDLPLFGEMSGKKQYKNLNNLQEIKELF